jgi:hypothetical protein
MATYRITAISTAYSLGGTHEHIERVELNDNPNCRISRHTVAADLRDVNGDRYYTLGGGKRADVMVMTCPACSFRDYITTRPDQTTANNLLHLPRF